MKMGQMIGTLDERTLHAELDLDELGPLARAYWIMTGYSVHPNQFARRFGENDGVVQFFYPGPVAKYARNGGIYNVKIFRNGGNPKQSEQLHHRLLDHVQVTTA